MAKMLNIKVLGVVENMSYIQCPDCDKRIKLFEGEETDKFLNEMDLDLLGELPMTKEIVNITHNGVSEVSENLDSILTGIVDKIK
jgi:Mrp family chromosome partitioning ATPase